MDYDLYVSFRPEIDLSYDVSQLHLLPKSGIVSLDFVSKFTVEVINTLTLSLVFNCL